MIALLVMTVLNVTGVLLFRHFVDDQIMDKGGMMNPDYRDGTETVPILDGEEWYDSCNMSENVINGLRLENREE